MSTLRLTTISNQSGSSSVPSDTVINGSAKAWVNFNGTGVVAIRASFNVSSITDNGTGDYTVNFTVAMVDANYAVAFGAGDYSVGGSNWDYLLGTRGLLTTYVRVIGHDNNSDTFVDINNCNVTVFR